LASAVLRRFTGSGLTEAGYNLTTSLAHGEQAVAGAGGPGAMAKVGEDVQGGGAGRLASAVLRRFTGSGLTEAGYNLTTSLAHGEQAPASPSPAGATADERLRPPMARRQAPPRSNGG
jgi:hypothetical protein